MSNLDFRVIKEIPASLTLAIQESVKDFMVSSDLNGGDVDLVGFYNSTLESIANATYLNGGGEFWVGTDEENKLLIYILGGVNTDVDGRLSYHVYQGWVTKEYRASPVVKEWWEMIRQRAKDLMCKHLIVHSSRGYEAYERFLGNGMKLYSHVLKESL